MGRKNRNKGFSEDRKDQNKDLYRDGGDGDSDGSDCDDEKLERNNVRREMEENDVYNKLIEYKLWCERNCVSHMMTKRGAIQDIADRIIVNQPDTDSDDSEEDDEEEPDR